jgi:16S rRNA G966 N2-methylase RsmD
MGCLEDLSEDVLRRLYLEENLTETEIADRFGTYQVKVNKLRRKWGIPTLLKSDRLRLPSELSPRLTSVLVGSMLGDGGIVATSPCTARYEEAHSTKQRAYLDWKVEEWGSFVSSVGPTKKGDHLGFRLMGHACRALYPYWKLFYPTGVGTKTFANLPINWVDSLALAVWYMDDGSRTSSYFRFSIGPDEESQQVQLRVLRKFGIAARLYDADPEDVSIHVMGRANATRFVDLVSPHIHPSMAHKLEVSRLRKRGSAPRETLTSERVQPLIDRGMRAQEIANVFQVSSQSVRRALDRMGVARQRTGRPKKREEGGAYTLEAANTLLGQIKSNPSFLEDAVRILSSTEIPIFSASESELSGDKALLLKANTRMVENGSIIHTTKAGALICNHFFPQRWDARYRTNPSVREAWYDPKMLRRAIKFQLSVGDPVTPVRVFRALQAVVRAPTNFRPCFAKAIVKHFSSEGGVVLDPCAGYGGRALGALSAGRSYIGVDPNSRARTSFDQVASLMGSMTFHNVPFEEVDLGNLQADLVFTSPPYYSVERYEDKTTQSWVRYSTWSAWVSGFLVPFVEKSWVHLRPGGYFVVNTKTVKYGDHVYPIPDALIENALRVGFCQMGTLAIPMGRLGKVAQTEPLFVFSRPL